MVRARPSEALRSHVRDYVGWRDGSSGEVCRREPPTDIVPLIINFGSPVRIYSDDRRSSWTEFSSFTTGVFDRYVLVGTAFGSGGLQVNLTIPGARVVLGRPLGALVNSVVSLDDLFGRQAMSLSDELFDARSWPARFAIVERELLRRVAVSHPPSAHVMRASSRLIASRGAMPIGAVVWEVGCSQKHLVEKFRQELGVTPKTLARVLRFGESIGRLKHGGSRLTDIALECGYYDQAHFDRDFRAFAGVTPSEFVLELSR